MWKLSCLLLFVLMLFTISPGESLALSTLTAQEMELVNGGCLYKYCEDDDPCTEKWCHAGWNTGDSCLTCTALLTNQRCIGSYSDRLCIQYTTPDANECGYYTSGKCSSGTRKKCRNTENNPPTPTGCNRAECRYETPG